MLGMQFRVRQPLRRGLLQLQRGLSGLRSAAKPRGPPRPPRPDAHHGTAQGDAVQENHPNRRRGNPDSPRLRMD